MWSFTIVRTRGTITDQLVDNSRNEQGTEEFHASIKAGMSKFQASINAVVENMQRSLLQEVTLLIGKRQGRNSSRG